MKLTIEIILLKPKLTFTISHCYDWETFNNNLDVRKYFNMYSTDVNFEETSTSGCMDTP